MTSLDDVAVLSTCMKVGQWLPSRENVNPTVEPAAMLEGA